MSATIGHSFHINMLDRFRENLRLTHELEQKILAMPGTREVYMHLRWHSQHMAEVCPICDTPSKSRP